MAASVDTGDTQRWRTPRRPQSNPTRRVVDAISMIKRYTQVVWRFSAAGSWSQREDRAHKIDRLMSSFSTKPKKKNTKKEKQNSVRFDRSALRKWETRIGRPALSGARSLVAADVTARRPQPIRTGGWRLRFGYGALAVAGGALLAGAGGGGSAQRRRVHGRVRGQRAEAGQVGGQRGAQVRRQARRQRRRIAALHQVLVDLRRHLGGGRRAARLRQERIAGGGGSGGGSGGGGGGGSAAGAGVGVGGGGGCGGGGGLQVRQVVEAAEAAVERVRRVQ